MTTAKPEDTGGERHHIFENYPSSLVIKMQARTPKREKVCDFEAHLTEDQMREVLEADHGPGRYVIVAFDADRQLAGGKDLIVDGSPNAAEDPGGVGARALSFMERQLHMQQVKIVTERAEVEARSKALDTAQNSQLQQLLDQQNRITKESYDRAKEILDEARERAKVIVEDARRDASSVEERAEARGRRAAEDMRRDAEDVLKRAQARLGESDQRMMLAESRERQSEAEREGLLRQFAAEQKKGEEELAARRVALEREYQEFKTVLLKNSLETEMKSQIAAIRAEHQQDWPEELRLKWGEAALKERFKGQGPVQELIDTVGPFVGPMIESFMAKQQPAQAPPPRPQPSRAQPRAIASDTAGPTTEMPPWDIPEMPAPPDLHSLVGGALEPRLGNVPPQLLQEPERDPEEVRPQG